MPRREFQFPDPVDVPAFGADGSGQGNRTFTAGGVRNFPNIPLLKEAVRHYQGRLRRGTASTKQRGEVRGTNRKPWRQKGTGRARAGTRKSPLWRGGGTVFGPKPRSYDYGINRKQRRLATRHALLSKFFDEEAKVVALPKLDGPSTSTMGKLFRGLDLAGTSLLVVASETPRAELEAIVQSCRNLHGVAVSTVADLNAYILLKQREMVVTEDALEELQEREDALRSDQEGAA